jgi:hypothetical protein
MNLGYHFDLIREAMNHLSEDAGTPVFSPDALAAALLGNSYTDLLQEENTERLMDDTFCRLAKPLIECLHYDLLAGEALLGRYTRQLLANGLEHAETTADDGDSTGFLLGLGVVLHVLQDLYAHSNWAELEVDRQASTVDPTFFNTLASQSAPLAAAIAANAALQIRRCEGERGAAREHGFYTHGSKDARVPMPRHDWMKKDFAGQPHFEWAYRAAFHASLQYLVMVRNHLAHRPGGPAFWTGLATYRLPDSVGPDVRTAASFEEGTVRWIATYGGAWKRGVRWDKPDMVSDNLPNVAGIGVLEQATSLPVLGERWFACTLAIAEGLFELTALEPGNARLRRFTRQSYIQALRDFGPGSGLEALSEFLDPAGLTGFLVEDVFGGDYGSPLADWLREHAFETVTPETALTPLAPAQRARVDTALAALADPVLQRYQTQITWIAIRSPHVRDLDDGDGWNNLNNEEIGGVSDFWLATSVDGLRYTEAEYVDHSEAFTNWLVLKPCLRDHVRQVRLDLYESDPSDHTDEQMDMTPGAGRTLTFGIHPRTGAVSGIPQGVDWFAQPEGTALRTRGTGDLRVELTVVAGVMSRHRVEIALRTRPTTDRPPGNPTWLQQLFFDATPCLKDAMVLSGGRGWRLVRPDYPACLNGSHDLFTFDPGPAFQPEHLADLRLVVGTVLRPVALEHLALRSADRETVGSFDPTATDSQLATGTVHDVGGRTDAWITASESELPLQTLSMVCLVPSDARVANPPALVVTLLGQPRTGGPEEELGRYRLLSPEPRTFRPGTAECFWLGPQARGDLDARAYTGPVKRIQRVRITLAGNGSLRLSTVEFHANGRLIGRSPGQVQWNNSNRDWHLGLSYPHAIRFASPPRTRCRGVQEIPGHIAQAGIAYTLDATILMEGYSVPPQVTLAMTPSHALAHASVTHVDAGRATLRGEIFLNRQHNPGLTYSWRITVRPAVGGPPQHLDARFDLPQPQLAIVEFGFQGGAELLTRHGHPTLGYQGSYGFELHHLGGLRPADVRSQLDLIPSYEGIPPLNDVRLFLPGRGEHAPALITAYRLRVQARDDHAIWPLDSERIIEIPTLAVRHQVVHHGKLHGYFPTASGFQRVSTDDPRYPLLAAAKAEVRAEYRFVEILLEPYQRRDGDRFSDRTFGVTYRWDVPRRLRTFRPDTTAQPPATEASTGIALDPRLPRNRTPVGWSRTSLSADLTESRILLDLQGAGVLTGSRIDCLIRDVLGQTVPLTVTVSNHTGATHAQLQRIAALKTYRLTLLRHAEHLHVRETASAGLRTEVPLIPFDVDPMDWERLTPVERHELDQLRGLVEVYQRYGTGTIARGKRLQADIDRLLQGLATDLEQAIPTVAH